MIKLKNILTEEIYGNKATVYHRTTAETLMINILSNEFKHSSGMYGEGIYTTYEPTKMTGWRKPDKPTGDLEKDNPEGRLNYRNYGQFQVKFMVDLINFFIFDWDVYKEVKPHIAKIEKSTKQKSDENNFINLQAEYFKLPYRINTPYRKRYTSELALEFGFNKKYTFFTNQKINGIIFFGSRDGNVLVCYNKKLLIPVSVKNDYANETINLQQLSNSNEIIKDKFKKYFSKFIKTKNVTMNNVEISLIELAKEMWHYDEKNRLFSYNGNVNIPDEFVKNGKLIIQFDEVHGDFKCSELMESLEGSPEYVGGNFHCTECLIESLEGGPKRVNLSFFASETSIKSLEGSPDYVGGDFWVNHTQLSSLSGFPKYIGGDFKCNECENLTSLESLNYSLNELQGGFECRYTNITSLKGLPNKINRHLDCTHTQITSLEGAPKYIGDTFSCNDCYNLTTLKGAPKYVLHTFSCDYCSALKSLKYLPLAVDHKVPAHLQGELMKKIYGNPNTKRKYILSMQNYKSKLKSIFNRKLF